MKSVHKYAAERKKCKEIIGKRVCAKDVTTLFFAFHIILFSNSRRSWVHSHKATNVATLGNI